MNKEGLLREIASVLEQDEEANSGRPIGCLLQLGSPTHRYHLEWDGEKLAPVTASVWREKAQFHLSYKGMDFDALTKRYEERCKDLFKKDTYVRELEQDLELLRAFLWDDHNETWPEDVHAALHRASNRLLRTRM